jgi:hypothetical protein
LLRSPAWALDVFVGPHRAGDLTSARGKGVLVTKLACAVDSDPSCPVFIA